jgi:hypothetical protein
MIERYILKEALMASYQKETSSYSDDWNKKNPAWGQCAITSCIVQDYLGGEIVWAEVILPTNEKISHYFNKINGKELDLTRVSFPEGTVVPGGIPKTKGLPTTREYVLSYEPTKLRYKKLKERVDEHLKKHYIKELIETLSRPLIQAS